MVKDTPLLINIKGCGYPPEVNCDIYSERYQNFSMDSLTFPCHYSVMNPWIVISDYDRSDFVNNCNLRFYSSKWVKTKQ